MYNKKHLYGAVSLHPSRKYDQSFYWRILPWNQFSCTAAECVSACVRMVCVEQRAVLRGQRGWQVWRFRLFPPGFSLWPRQVRPEPQSQRWKISRLWAPFRRWRVHTCPSVSTGLQIRDQKCRAQQSPSTQSEDLRHVSPSPPDRLYITSAFTSPDLCEIKHVWSTGSFEFRHVNLRRDETTARWKMCNKAGWAFYLEKKD